MILQMTNSVLIHDEANLYHIENKQEFNQENARELFMQDFAQIVTNSACVLSRNSIIPRENNNNWCIYFNYTGEK